MISLGIHLVRVFFSQTGNDFSPINPSRLLKADDVYMGVIQLFPFESSEKGNDFEAESVRGGAG